MSIAPSRAKQCSFSGRAPAPRAAPATTHRFGQCFSVVNTGSGTETDDLPFGGDYAPRRPLTCRHVPPQIFSVCFMRSTLWQLLLVSDIDTELLIGVYWSTPCLQERASIGLFSTWIHSFFFVLCHTWLLPLKSSLYNFLYTLLHLSFPFRLGSQNLSYTLLHRILAQKRKRKKGLTLTTTLPNTKYITQPI